MVKWLKYYKKCKRKVKCERKILSTMLVRLFSWLSQLRLAQADEVATQTPSVTEGNQYQPATAAEIFGGEAALPATPSSTVSAPVATSEVAKASAPAYLRHLRHKVQRL